MKYLSKSIFILISVLFFLSCKKEENINKDSQNSPKFIPEITIDTLQIKELKSKVDTVSKKAELYQFFSIGHTGLYEKTKTDTICTIGKNMYAAIQEGYVLQNQDTILRLDQEFSLAETYICEDRQNIYIIYTSENFDSGGSEITSIKKTTLEENWSYFIGGFNLSRPEMDGDTIYIASFDHISKLSLSSGKFYWRRDSLFHKYRINYIEKILRRGNYNLYTFPKSYPDKGSDTLLVDNISGKIIGSLSETNVDSLGINLKSNQKKIEFKNGSIIQVGLLTKSYKGDDYYFELFFKNQYSDSINQIIQHSFIEPKSEIDELTFRVKIHDSVARKYFETDGLDALFLFDTNQNIVDTIYRKNFEYYSESIESYYAATYDVENNTNDEIVAITASNIDSLMLKKSPNPKSITDYENKILERNHYDYCEVFFQTSMINKSDTITLISFGNYQNYKNYLYLYENGKTKDSIVNDYLAVSNLRPVPLATENEFIFNYSGYKPDTDWLWGGLLGIDIKNWKIKFYERNNLKR